ncbi:MAG: Ribonuclease HII [Chlamydiae bacterium]|nr:Ribonuclease HII [Chlamydiota bacterium]
MPPKLLKTAPLPKDEKKRLKKLVKFETEARKRGFERIAGVDEAGRGPLAGPVVAAACLISRGLFFEGINDSKLLTEKRRKALFLQITGHSDVQYGIGIVDAKVIDEINIYQATILAMHQAVENLPELPDFLLVDAMPLAFRKLHSEAIIKGDLRSQSIAAAAIIAKVTRDEIMIRHHRRYPHYGFDQHKGYGTKKHKKALEEHGPCPIHRFSFAPVKMTQY